MRIFRTYRHYFRLFTLSVAVQALINPFITIEEKAWYAFCMEEQLDTPEEFFVLKRARSFTYAVRGIWLLMKTTPNACVHVVVFSIALGLGFYFGITKTEWILLILAGGFVLTAEAFNTAIEIDINLTSPNYHPYAKDTKDVAAGAVLISAITALVIGILIFVPYVV